MSERLTVAQVNSLDDADFVERFGGVFEHSPWAAANAARRRPFADFEALRTAFEASVRDAGEDRQLELLRAHPELAGRAAREGTLTADSAGEQASVGLHRLTPEEHAELGEINRSYGERFGFPMIVAVREHTKDSIFAQARERLRNPRSDEVERALGEVFKIAGLRLRDLVDPNLHAPARQQPGGSR